MEAGAPEATPQTPQLGGGQRKKNGEANSPTPGNQCAGRPATLLGVRAARIFISPVDSCADGSEPSARPPSEQSPDPRDQPVRGFDHQLLGAGTERASALRASPPTPTARRERRPREPCRGERRGPSDGAEGPTLPVRPGGRAEVGVLERRGPVEQVLQAHLGEERRPRWDRRSRAGLGSRIEPEPPGGKEGLAAPAASGGGGDDLDVGEPAGAVATDKLHHVGEGNAQGVRRPGWHWRVPLVSTQPKP